MKKRNILFCILIGLIMFLLAGCSAEEKIKGTWYIIDADADKEVTLDIFDETAVYHNNGYWDDYYIEWTLDDDNLVLNMDGESFHYQVLDDPDYGEVLYDPDEERIYACHEQEKAQILINEILEERERKRQANLQVFQAMYDEAQRNLIGTWVMNTKWDDRIVDTYTYVFNEDGTYSYTKDGKYSDDEETGTYKIISVYEGEEYEYIGYMKPDYVNLAIMLSEQYAGGMMGYWTIDLERLKEGYLNEWALFSNEEYEKID